jgi:hypothetical protein
VAEKAAMISSTWLKNSNELLHMADKAAMITYKWLSKEK